MPKSGRIEIEHIVEGKPRKIEIDDMAWMDEENINTRSYTELTWRQPIVWLAIWIAAASIGYCAGRSVL